MALSQSAPEAPVVVSFEGDLDGPLVIDLVEALVKAIVVDRSDLVVDLRGVARINDLAIGILERTGTVMKHRARSMTVRATPPVRAAIAARGLTELFEGPVRGYGARWPMTDA